MISARRIVVTLLLLAAASGACGNGSPTSEPTTVVTEPVPETPGTTSYIASPCFKFPTEVLKLQNDFRIESRGVALPDAAKYRARAQALLDEARRLGCPDPVGLSSFLR
jgi:hypothetical protein